MLQWPGSRFRMVRERFGDALCRSVAYGQGGGRPALRGADGTGTAEQGSAVVEFTFLALLLMVPVVYFIVTIAQIQGGSFAVVGAADQAAKVFVTQKDPAKAHLAAEQAALIALADHGHGAELAKVHISCDRSDCLSAGTAVTATVSLTVPLPMVPFGDTLRLDASHLNASATQIVGRFR